MQNLPFVHALKVTVGISPCHYAFRSGLAHRAIRQCELFLIFDQDIGQAEKPSCRSPYTGSCLRLPIFRWLSVALSGCQRTERQYFGKNATSVNPTEDPTRSYAQSISTTHCVSVVYILHLATEIFGYNIAKTENRHDCESWCNERPPRKFLKSGSQLPGAWQQVIKCCKRARIDDHPEKHIQSLGNTLRKAVSRRVQLASGY